MVEVFRATSGDLTASVLGSLLHSRNDPRKEARRFVERNWASTHPATVVLLGTGLGYLIDEIRDRFPLCRLIALSPLDVCRDEYKHLADAYVGSNSDNLSHQLMQAIRPQDVGGLELLEWAPELKAVPERSEPFKHALRATVSDRNADIATTGFFGRKYIRNSFRTALFAEAAFSPAPRSRAVCIAASGPSIAKAAQWLIANRDRLELWALSSATPALAERGIDPDMVVHQDAGFYAYDHLTTPARGACANVLMPMTALPPPGELRSKPTLFSQSTPIEDDLYASLGITPFRIREAGTVAATATSLALQLTRGPVYLAGLDLSQRDIEAHARPHAFEHYLWRQESRLAPVFSAMAAYTFERTAPVEAEKTGRNRTNRGLEAYAQWFRRLPPETKARLRRVHPSPVTLDIEDATGTQPSSSPSRAPQGFGANTEPLPLPSPDRRRELLQGTVARWRAQLTEELAGFWATRRSGREELSYLISAPDYVAAVASARRGNTDAQEQSVERIAERAETLFSRLEYMLDHHADSRSGKGS